MAKQSGIHQLRGKVGEMSYYRQSGVSGGLVRGINPGMSSRVKTSVEYANTRLNNDEFKTATQYAANILRAVVPLYRPMFNTFRNAKLAAKVLELIKSNTGAWGRRIILPANQEAVIAAVNSLSKNRAADLITLTTVEDADYVKFNAVVPGTMKDVLNSIGATGVDIKCYDVAVYEATAATPVAERAPMEIRVSEPITLNFDVNDATGDSDTAEVTPLLPDLTIYTKLPVITYFAYAVIMPYREVDGNKYVLQEGCALQLLSDLYDRS